MLYCIIVDLPMLHQSCKKNHHSLDCNITIHPIGSILLKYFLSIIYHCYFTWKYYSLNSIFPTAFIPKLYTLTYNCKFVSDHLFHIIHAHFVPIITISVAHYPIYIVHCYNFNSPSMHCFTWFLSFFCYHFVCTFVLLTFLLCEVIVLVHFLLHIHIYVHNYLKTKR